jgi:hypothetical protein
MRIVGGAAVLIGGVAANSQAIAAIGATWLLFAAMELLAGRPKSPE